PGTDRLLNALFWDKRVDPIEWQPHPTAFGRLADAGVSANVVSKSAFEGSGLTRASQRGARFLGADDADQRIAAAIRASGDRPSVTYVYDSDLDATGHKHGVDSVQWRGQLSMIDGDVEHLRESLPSEVRLLVVADHGMVDAIDPEDRIDVDAFPELRQGVALLGGADVVTREQAIERGWFGDVAERVLPRIGDVLVAARGTTAFFSSVDFNYEMSLVGLHGSLTPAEMRIPILVS
ncbi:MAG: alkaline phosphatase family protein, partial [Myxococcales bacterium]